MKIVTAAEMHEIDRRTTEEFGAQVVRVMEDAALRDRLGREAAQLYEREFTWERVASRLLAVLEAERAPRVYA